MQMNKPKQMQFTYGGKVYTYELYLGGVKRLNLRIRPDGSIRVSAPLLTLQRRINDFLSLYGDKIETAVARAQERQNCDVQMPTRAEQQKQKERLLAIIRECHRNVVLPRFASLSLEMTEQQRQFITTPTAIRIRVMKTRWGSCNFSKGTLNFNLHLIDQPIECVEYVVMHEFAHFIHPNHSSAYYALMTRLMLDWKVRRNQLNRISIPRL